MIRKIRRNILRIEANKQGFKPSKYIKEMWDKIYVKKYGAHVRALCMLYSTKTGTRANNAHRLFRKAKGVAA